MFCSSASQNYRPNLTARGPAQQTRVLANPPVGQEASSSPTPAHHHPHFRRPLRPCRSLVAPVSPDPSLFFVIHASHLLFHSLEV